MFGFQAASVATGTPFHCDMAARLANAVGGTGAVMRLQGCKGPIGIRHHMNAALGADQDGDIGRVGRRFSSGFRGFENRFGVLEKCPHD